MVCVNDLTKLNSHKHSILEPLVILLSPFAPHMAEELWKIMGKKGSVVSDVVYPIFDETYLKENSFEYPVAINGKTKTKISFPIDMPKGQIEKEIITAKELDKWLKGITPKRVIVVPNRMINVVV
jgi:leucyl-tRNA synthetase